MHWWNCLVHDRHSVIIFTQIPAPSFFSWTYWDIANRQLRYRRRIDFFVLMKISVSILLVKINNFISFSLISEIKVHIDGTLKELGDKLKFLGNAHHIPYFRSYTTFTCCCLIAFEFLFVVLVFYTPKYNTKSTQMYPNQLISIP